MTKGELIRSLDGLMDETEIVVGTVSTNSVWDILTVGYMKTRGDEPAYVRLSITGASHIKGVSK
jgi:hypothetical protein